MRLSAAFSAILTVWLIGGQLPDGQAPRRGTAVAIPAEALSQARTRGIVRVIVGLDLAFSPEALIGAARAATQRASIAATQALVLGRFAGTATPARRFTYVPYLAIEVDEAGLQALASMPEVASIDLDTLVAPSLAESTPLVGASAAWSAGYSGAGWTIAVLDSGVDKSHPFLAGKVVSEACYSTTSPGTSTSVCPGGAAQSTAPDSAAPCSMSSCAHGTHVAGIAAGNGIAFSGVAKDASLIAIQVFSAVETDCGSEPTPCARGFQSDLIAGLERVYALRNSHNIAAVNLSLGSGLFTQPCDTNPTKSIIDQLRGAGIATIASSGNDGSTIAMSQPACVSTAISVGSTTDGSSGHAVDQVSGFSNSSQYLTLLAPGQTITSSIPGGGFASFNGTSMAAPHVAGAWAVLKSRRAVATVAEISAALTSTGVGVFDTGNGLTKPRIRVDAAVQSLQPPCEYAVTPLSVRLPRSGGSAFISVTTDAGCPWSASTNASFVSIVGAPGGNGSGSLTLSVAANSLVVRRHALVIVAGASVAIEQLGATAGDVDGNNRPDLLWQNLTSGALAVWALNGATVAATSRLSVDRPDVNWRLVGGGDLNGDGLCDLVWQHQTQGSLEVWYLSGTQVIGSAPLSIGAVPNTDWQIRAVGDTNGDGFADLLWQHRTEGWLAVWYMVGATVGETRFLSIQQVPDTNWQIAAAGDTNGDGRADVIWHNVATGSLAAWQLNGYQVGAQQLLSIPGVSNLSWRVRAAADANGDGNADLLWQNTATGELAVWYLNAFTVIGTAKLSLGITAGSPWQIAGPG